MEIEYKKRSSGLGSLIGLVLGLVVGFALLLALTSHKTNNDPCAPGYQRTVTTCIK